MSTHREERICRQNTPTVAQSTHHRACGRHAHLPVPKLEDLVRPGHGDGHGGAEPKADEEEARVPRPGVQGWGVGGEKEAGDLNAHWEGEEEGTVVVKAVREGGDDEDGYEVALEGYL